jgi:uncharacterized LabA/DUF88 family protein
MTTSTFLQIDLQNIFYAARNKGKRIDFEKVWDYFNRREAEFLTSAYVYMIRSPAFYSKGFESKLKAIGYGLKIRTAVRSGPKGKETYIRSDQDIPIVIDCMNRANSFDKLILMSGDGDFSFLCEDLRSKNKQVEIWSFKESFNPILQTCADKINFIEESFFYKPPRVKEFGIGLTDLESI